MDTGAVSLSTATNNALQGLRNVDQQISQTSQNIASGSLDPQDIVSLSQAATSAKANVAVLKASNEATQSLLNITA